MPDISFQPINDLAALEARWRALEAVGTGGFFRGWSYLGTLLPHFSAPMLLAVRQGGEDMALGVVNEARSWRGTRLSLNEAGAQPWDRIFVEHNGLLLRPGAESCLDAAMAFLARRGTVVLSGIDAAHLHAARRAGQVTRETHREAPAIDLAAVSAAGASYLDTLSANARAQIRRALRLYGPMTTLTAARNEAEALDFFDRLASLHQASWTGRGQPGAFAEPAIRAWHRQLIRAALPRREAALLRIAAGPRDIGFLYQFQRGGRVLHYQAGLAAEADARLKPGLVCHALAIEHARGEGARVYDFLAGAQRYKTTLVSRGHALGETLYWVTLERAGSLRGRWAKLEKTSFLKKRS